MKAPKNFVGKWRIVQTELWDSDALDMIVPAHITFDAHGLGHFQMIAVVGDSDERDTCLYQLGDHREGVGHARALEPVEL